MKCAVLAVTTLFLISALTSAQDAEPMHNHHKMEGASTNEPPIRISINPEARVSVTLGGALPPPTACGTVTDLAVKIVNQGFVTARLEAQFVGEAPAGVTLDFHPEPLRGIPEELRKLHITMTKPGPTDLTLAFKAHNEIPDLGGRDRIHFLISCAIAQ